MSNTTDPYTVLLQPPSINGPTDIPSAVQTSFAQGLGGTIHIVSGSKSTFAVGGTSGTTNGTSGSLEANGWSGGTVTVINNVGGITVAANSISVAAESALDQAYFGNADERYLGGHGGNISLQAPNGTIQAGVTGTLSADATITPQGDSQGGSIVISAKVINTTSTAKALNLSARSDTTSGSGTGGTIVINQTSTSAKNVLNVGKNSPLNMTVAGSASDGTILINSAAGMVIAGKLATGGIAGTGSMTLSVGGASNIATNNGLVITGNLNLITVSGNVGSASGALSTGALSTASGTDTISIVNTGALSIDGAISTPGTVALTAQSNTSCPSCAISVNQNITAGSITLTADGAGTGGGIAGNALIAAQTVVLNATDDGIDAMTATGNPTMNVSGTSGGSTGITIVNLGNVVFSTGTSTNVASLDFQSTGSITTSGKMTQIASITLDNSETGNQSITIGGVLGANSTTSSVTLNAGGSIVQSTSTNYIQGGSITLTSQNGNIGMPTRAFNGSNVYTPGGTAIQLNVVGETGTPGTLTIQTNNNTTNANGNPGTIYVNNTSTTGIDIAGIAGGSDVVITTAGDITVSGEVGSNFGSIMLQNTSTESGVISVSANVIATGGPVVIQNSNTDTTVPGRITINSGVTLQGSSWRIDNNTINAQTGVALLVGAGPFFPPVAETTPTPAPTVTGSGGSVFYGPNSITINASPVDINVTGAGVMFSGDVVDAIILDSNVTINAPSQVQVLSALTTTALAAAASQSGSGVTVSGNTYTIQNNVNLANLGSINLPSTITVQLNNFGTLNPIAVNTQTGTKNASMSADMLFVSTGSAGSQVTINANSAVTGVVLTIPSAGKIVSDGTLRMNIGGNLTLAGALGANNLLTLYTGAAVASGKPSAKAVYAGTIALSGSLSAGTNTDFGTINIISSGNITQTAGSIAADTLLVTIGGTNSGYAASTMTLKTVAADLVEIQGLGTGGNISISGAGISAQAIDLLVANSPVLINQTGSFALSGTVLNTLTANSSTGITTAGDINCGNCNFSTPSLTFLNNIASTNAFGTITIASPTRKDLTLIGTDGTTSGAMQAPAGLTVNSSGALTITGGDYFTTAGSLAMGSAKKLAISDATLTAGTAGILLGGVVPPSSILTSGSINLTAKTGGLSAIVGANSIGGSITAIANSGDVNLAGIYQADGGNITVATGSGKVTGDAATFVANATGTAPTNQHARRTHPDFLRCNPADAFRDSSRCVGL